RIVESDRDCWRHGWADPGDRKLEPLHNDSSSQGHSALFGRQCADMSQRQSGDCTCWQRVLVGAIEVQLISAGMARDGTLLELSYATTRIVYGRFSNQVPSRFLPHTNGPFLPRQQGLSAPEVQAVIAATTNL